VVLHVDHINPVANGGNNDIFNLVTSCVDCNQGKADRLLSDNSALVKQQNQAKLVSEKHQQIEMLAKWHKEMAQLDLKVEQIVRDEINKHLEPVRRSVSDIFFNSEIRRAIKKYPLNVVLDSINASATIYLKDIRSSDDWAEYINKIPKICYWKNEELKNPHLNEYRKIAFTAKKLWWNCYVNELVNEIKNLHEDHGLEISQIKKIAFGVKSISEFRQSAAKLIGEDYV